MNSQQCFELLTATAEICHQQVRTSQAAAELKAAIDKAFESVRDEDEAERKRQDETS